MTINSRKKSLKRGFNSLKRDFSHHNFSVCLHNNSLRMREIVFLSTFDFQILIDDIDGEGGQSGGREVLLVSFRFYGHR